MPNAIVTSAPASVSRPPMRSESQPATGLASRLKIPFVASARPAIPREKPRTLWR